MFQSPFHFAGGPSGLPDFFARDRLPGVFFALKYLNNMMFCPGSFGTAGFEIILARELLHTG